MFVFYFYLGISQQDATLGNSNLKGRRPCFCPGDMETEFCGPSVSYHLSHSHGLGPSIYKMKELDFMMLSINMQFPQSYLCFWSIYFAL